ncbi:MAG: DUF4386 domain-containing protein [Bacteroidota bacterium]
MTRKSSNLSTKTVARVAGFLGLLVLICGSTTHTINSEIIDLSNDIGTASNFHTFEAKYRLGFVCGLLMETIFIFYAFLLYYLLQVVNKDVAKLMLLLALIPAPIFFTNQLNHFASFLVSSQDTEQMIHYLKLHQHGGFIISIFFGLWLFPLGYLVYQSTFLPKMLGILLMIGCFGYLISFFQGFLFPNQIRTLWTNPALVVTHLAEIGFMFWLLIMGVETFSKH